jgi:hypothetical protein
LLWILRGTIFFKPGLGVVNPSDVKRDKERYQKTDALDSKNLSNQLKSGVLKVFPEEHNLTLARHRTQVTKNYDKPNHISKVCYCFME